MLGKKKKFQISTHAHACWIHWICLSYCLKKKSVSVGFGWEARLLVMTQKVKTADVSIRYITTLEQVVAHCCRLDTFQHLSLIPLCIYELLAC